MGNFQNIIGSSLIARLLVKIKKLTDKVHKNHFTVSLNTVTALLE